MTSAPEGRPRLWTWPFIAVGIVNLFTSLTFLLLMSFVAVYAAERFGEGQAAAGFAASVFIVGALASRLVAGAAVEILGRKPLLIGALVIMGVAALLLARVDSYGAFLALRLVQGIGFGVANTATNTVAQDLIPSDRRGEGTGWYSMSVILSQALGPFLGITLHLVAGFDAVFTVAFGLASAGALFALLAPIARSPLTGEERRALARIRPSSAIERRALPMASLAMLLGAGYSGVLTFLGSATSGTELASWAGAFFLVYAVVLVVTRPLAGLIVDRVGDNAVVVPGIAATALALALIAWLPSGWVLLAAAVLLACGYGSLVSACQAIAVLQSPDHRRSIAVSTYYIGLDAGVGFGPLVLGALAGIVGFSGMYAVAAVGVAVVAGPWYWFLHGRGDGRGNRRGGRAASG